MAYKTIALTGAEIEVDISGQNCDIRNDGTGVVYASAEAGITAGADGVLSVPAGGAAKLLDSGGTVHLLGTGSVQLCGNDYSEPVFKTAATSSGEGGEDTVARNAIEAHANNSAIHLTAEQLSAAVDNANAYADGGDEAALGLAKEYADSGDSLTLTAAKEYADSLSGGTGGVSQTYVDEGDSNTLSSAKAYADSVVQPVSAAVDILNGTGDGSVSKTVADSITQIIADAPEDLDTLKEISDWISAHPDDAAAMNSAIAQNTSDITANAAAIAEINNADSGILAQAKEYADGKAIAATEVTLTADSWSASGRADYPYKAVISDSSVAAADTAEVVIGLDYLSTAQSAKIAASGVTVDGGIELYAKTVPNGDIGLTYYIVKGV